MEAWLKSSMCVHLIIMWVAWKMSIFQLFTLNTLNKRTHPKAEHTIFSSSYWAPTEQFPQRMLFTHQQNSSHHTFPLMFQNLVYFYLVFFTICLKLLSQPLLVKQLCSGSGLPHKLFFQSRWNAADVEESIQCLPADFDFSSNVSFPYFLSGMPTF